MKVDKHSMNIEEASHVSKSEMDPAKRGQQTRPAQSGKDSLDVSCLARLVAKHASELPEIHRLRPEKVAQYRDTATSDAEISDEAVDTIFRRMLS